MSNMHVLFFLLLLFLLNNQRRCQEKLQQATYKTQGLWLEHKHVPGPTSDDRAGQQAIQTTALAGCRFRCTTWTEPPTWGIIQTTASAERCPPVFGLRLGQHSGSGCQRPPPSMVGGHKLSVQFSEIANWFYLQLPAQHDGNEGWPPTQNRS